VLPRAIHLVLSPSSNTDQALLQLSNVSASKALQLIVGGSRTQLSQAYRRYDDLGDAAESFFQKHHPPHPHHHSHTIV